MTVSWLLVGLLGCGGPTADIVCAYEADGLLGADEGEYVAFTFACDQVSDVGEGLAGQEEETCEEDLIGGGATTAVCTCEVVPGPGCAP